MSHYNVEVVCTTDDPADTLASHASYARETSADPKLTRMLPTWRPDKAMAIEDPAAYRAYIEKLGQTAGRNITTYTDLTEVLQQRHDFFASLGCRLSDHGLSEFYAEDYTESEIKQTFLKVMEGKQPTADEEPTADEVNKFRSALLLEFARQDARAGWTQQFHYGPMRNNNTRMFKQLGPDTGFDSIGTWNTSQSLSRFLDKLNSEGNLAKTILYCINPSDNEMLATMIGNFQEGPTPGKIQFGSGWWFNDQLDGMERQMNALSVLGLLSRFVGMLTDSRSFLSYPRHEYFRRQLCNMIGQDVEDGKLPAEEMPFIEQMVRDISYYNAKRYFNF